VKLCVWHIIMDPAAAKKKRRRHKNKTSKELDTSSDVHRGKRQRLLHHGEGSDVTSQALASQQAKPPKHKKKDKTKSKKSKKKKKDKHKNSSKSSKNVSGKTASAGETSASKEAEGDAAAAKNVSLIDDMFRDFTKRKQAKAAKVVEDKKAEAKKLVRAAVCVALLFALGV